MTVQELINILNQYDPNTEVVTRHYSYFNCIGCGEDAYIDPDEEIEDLYESDVSLRDGKVIITCD